jgi:hypothetical protein
MKYKEIDLKNPIILKKVILHLNKLIEEHNLIIPSSFTDVIHALKRLSDKSLEEVILIFEENSRDGAMLRSLALSVYDEE